MWTLLLSLAFADIPPPAGYVETCTPEQQCGDIAGEACEAWHGGREDCEALEARGWIRMCQTAGASTWSEVFCETQPANPPAKRPAATKKWDCSALPPTSGLVWFLTLFAVARSTRHRTHQTRPRENSCN